MSHIIKVTIINLETNKETELQGKKRSRCLFMDWFDYNGYRIQLRLDYNFKPTVAPTLDADIVDRITGKLIKHETWHHTEKKYDAESKINMYNFKFEGLALKLYTVTDAAADMSFKITVGKKDETKID